MSTDARILPLYLAEVHLPEGERWPADRPFPVVAHAVAHRDGVFLFDTGFGSGNAEVDEHYTPVRFSLEDALAAHGVAVGDVTAVANCHLHIDHAGHNLRFSGLPIFVQRREWAMVHEPDYTVPEWVDAPGLSYEVLDGEDEVAPGVRVLPTPGHTAGHQSLVVETSGGPVLIAGQAVLTLDEWAGRGDPTRSGEPEEGRPEREDYDASVRRLRDVDPIRVHFVHDPDVWERPA